MSAERIDAENKELIYKLKVLNRMKTNLLKVAFVAAIALVSGINVFNAQKSATLSDVALANVEALADLENNHKCSANAECKKNGEYVGSISCSGSNYCISGSGYVTCDNKTSFCG